MSIQLDAEYVWYMGGKCATMAVYIKPSAAQKLGSKLPSRARVSNTYIAVISKPIQKIVYRCKTRLTESAGEWTGGPVFAILAGADSGSFQGSQLNFRDIMQEGKSRGIFIYVLPVSSVRDSEMWEGYVRLGYLRWIAIPCPRPQSVYNRIPTRYLENRPQAILAKQMLKYLGISLFNPNYFNKAAIYEIIRNASMGHYLPRSANALTKTALFNLLNQSNGVYLKPAGGSVGHGMIRIEQNVGGYMIQTLKNGVCEVEQTQRPASVWEIVEKRRVPGHYVLQEAIPLLQWHGRPCDFRVLLQKHTEWKIVGKGVRVSGPRTITTHVPNGGYIADATEVLTGTFGSLGQKVEIELDKLVTDCAKAIDVRYNRELGEMSMDIGIDNNGRPWFFEANAKPMKFDEPEIREKSVTGVVDLMLSFQSNHPTSPPKT